MNSDYKALRVEIREESKSYKQDDTLEYEILSALDTSTCPICGSMDGKHFKIKDAVIGKNVTTTAKTYNEWHFKMNLAHKNIKWHK